MFQPYIDKIVWEPLIVDSKDFNFQPIDYFDVSSEHWRLEKMQRNHIANAINFFDDKDRVHISDIDEIPNVDCFKHIDVLLNEENYLTLKQTMHFYNLKCKTNIDWTRSIVTTKKKVIELTPDWLRINGHTFDSVPDGGWHLTYFMSPEMIKTKLENFAHQEFNNSYWTDLDKIKERVHSGQDFYGRDQISLELVDQSFYPENFIKHFNKFN
jgi:beta-1,4-mannosyl-glycoprotein beta-1,4-N-acetylglucosaminyltransferase